MKVEKKKIFLVVISILIICLIFLFSNNIGHFSNDTITTNPKNSFELKNINPKSNFYLYILLVGLFGSYGLLIRQFFKSICLHDLNYLPPTKEPLFKYLFLIVFAFGIFSLSIETYHAKGESLDTFHEGDFLSPYVNLKHGSVPYKDFFFSQGYFQNIGAMKMSANLFGESISSRKKIESLTKILAFALLGVSVIVLSWRNLTETALSSIGLLLLSYTFLITTPRDLFVFVFIILGILTLRTNSRLNTHIYVFLSVVTVYLAFYHSVEKGLYCLASLIVLVFLKIILAEKKIEILFTALLTFSICLIVFNIITRFSLIDIFEYIKFVNNDYSKIYGYPIDLGTREWILFLIGLGLSSFFFFSKIDLKELIQFNLESLVLKYGINLFLFAVVLTTSISSITRGDKEHLSYAVSVSYLYVFWNSSKMLIHVSKPYFASFGKQINMFLIIILIAITTHRLILVFQDDLISKNFPNQNDTFFLDKDYILAKEFLRNEYLNMNKKSYPINSETIWFYLLDQPCDCRFQMAIFYQYSQNGSGVKNRSLRS
ncbi:MAG: hypothetical protein SNJ77_12175 [Cytophagales bacterium]